METMMNSDKHIVYAVLDTVGTPKVPVSAPKSWNAAVDRWADLDNVRIAAIQGNASYPTAGLPRDGYADVPVRFFAVRSADDPEWPADAAMYHRKRGQALVRSTGGRFI